LLGVLKVPGVAGFLVEGEDLSVMTDGDEV
jgi:hypothetical protein